MPWPPCLRLLGSGALLGRDRVDVRGNLEHRGKQRVHLRGEEESVVSQVSARLEACDEVRELLDGGWRVCHW